MQNLRNMPCAVSRNLRTIFSDIDDTLTVNGLIPGSAFAAICSAREAGLSVVLVTGRPAGWCDHLARMWPIDGVVGENGAIAFAMRGGQMRRLFAPRPPDATAKLDAIRQQVLAEVPGCKVAADQPYREYDLAIDIAEEVDRLPEQDVDRIVDIFHQHGATAKVSSIHVNGWLGDHDKLTMCRRFCRELDGAELDTERATFIGDSPNDEPMFRSFPHSCGVANVRHFAARMQHSPTYVTEGEGGYGFAELVAHLLES